MILPKNKHRFPLCALHRAAGGKNAIRARAHRRNAFPKGRLLKSLAFGLGLSAVGMLPFGQQSARAQSATWNASPTNGFWEATGAENNWSTGPGLFPGDISGSTTNTDIGTFLTSSTTTISINSSTGNTSPLNIGGITFGNVASASAFTIGSTTGNALWLTSGGQINITSGRTTAGALETINAPIVLQPASATSAGTYTFSNASALAGDILNFGGTITGGTTTAGITLTLTGASTTANTISGVIGDGGAAGGVAISKTSSGNWTLSGLNTYTGNTTVAASGGTLTIGGAGQLGAGQVGSGNYAGAISIGTSGTFAYGSSAYQVLSGGVTDAGTFNSSGAGTLTLSGAISGAGALNATGTGRVIVSNSNTSFTGAVSISGGSSILRATATQALGSNTLTINTTGNAVTDRLELSGGISLNNAITLGGRGTANNISILNVSGNNTVSGTITGLTGGANYNFQSDAGTLTMGTAGATVISSTSSGRVTNFLGNGNISVVGNIVAGGGMAIAKFGTGTLTLSGANAYTGGTTINGGTLAISGSGTLGATTGALALAGGTLDLGTTSQTVGAVTITTANSAIQNGNLTGTSYAASNIGGNSTVSANLLGTGALAKSGAGTLTLTGTNSYSGTTTISGGVLSTSLLANGGSNSGIGSSSNAAANLVINGGILQYTGATTSTDRNYTFGDSGVTLDASGTGPLTLSGTATYVTTNAARTLTLTGTNTGANTLSGVLANNGTGALSITKNGVGTWVLSGASSFSGTMTVNAGTLQLGDGTSGSTSAAAPLTFTGTGTFNRVAPAVGTTQALGTLTFSAGAATVQSTYGTSGTSVLSFSSVATRTAGATANFVSNGGTNGSTNTIAAVIGSNGALANRGYYFNGTDFAAYDSTIGGIRAVNYGSDTNTAPVNTITSAMNVKITSSVTGRASTSLLSLNLQGSGVSYGNAASQTLTITNGGLIKSGGGTGATISGGTGVTTGGASEFVIRTDTTNDTLDIQTPILSTSTSGLTKSGAGTLTLSATGNAYTGTTTVDEGTLSMTGTYTGGGGLVVNGGTFTGGSSGTNSFGAFTVTGPASSATLTSGTYGTTSATNGITVDNGGSLTVNGATLNAAGTNGYLPIGNTLNTTSTLTLTSGTVNVTNTFGAEVGRIGNGVLNVNGGTFIVTSSTGLVIGDQTTAQSGTVNLTNSSGTAGVLRVYKLVSSNGVDTFNFNGGTLQAAATTNGGTAFWASAATLTANVRNSGGAIDNNGTAITIAQPLLHSTITGDNATDGGLTFTGSGTTTLSGANTYNGTTAVNAGILLLSSTGSINNSNTVNMTATGALTLQTAAGLSDNAALSLITGTMFNLNAAAGTSETIGSLTVNGTSQAAGTYTAAQLDTLTGTSIFASSLGETLTILGVTPVPEPSTWMAGALLVGVVGYSQRRRFRGVVRVNA